MSTQSNKLNLLNFGSSSIRTLHLTWFAFFLTFAMWFSHVPMKEEIMSTFGLNGAQWKALLALNVALTIPARIVIGILVDKFGPRIVFSVLLFTSALITFGFAFSTDWHQAAALRFLSGFIGAGFVIGIRLVGEWFPAKTVGMAEGVYGGWGNFGSAAAFWLVPAFTAIAANMTTDIESWRIGIFTVGVIALLYSFVFYARARNTPKGATYFKPKKSGGLEVSNKRDFWFYAAMNIPMYLALALLTWKVSNPTVQLLSANQAIMVWCILAVLFVYQFYQILYVNREVLQKPLEVHDSYKFKQVAILDWAYFVTFGSELAVISMLPGFFADTFGISMGTAALLGSAFAMMNLVARPGGGYLSDKFGRKKTLLILLAGLTVGYVILSQIGSGWPIALAVVAVMFCSFFVQAGEGAVFSMVPLIKRRMTGQIAGMVGAFGNVGGVTFLTLYALDAVNASSFFLIIAAAAVLCFIVTLFLDEPQGHMTEVLADGTIQKIEIG